MPTKTLTLPEFMFIVATRGMLGLGAGLLLAGKLDARTRRTLGATLAAIGAVTTVPAAMLIFGERPDRMLQIAR